MQIINSNYCIFFKRQYIWNYNYENIPYRSNNIFIHSLVLPNEYKNIATIQYTTSVNLQCEIEEIRKNFRGKLNWYLNNAVKKEFSYMYVEKLNFSYLKEILHHYNDFAINKGIPLMKSKWFKNYIDSNKLLLTKILHQGHEVVHHIYLVSGNRIILLLSYNIVKNNIDSQLRSMANRYLHFLDICKFKEIGFEVYDLGGISMKDNDTLRDFKMSFGGETEEQYAFVRNVGLYRYMYNLLKFLRKKFKN